MKPILWAAGGLRAQGDGPAPCRYSPAMAATMTPIAKAKKAAGQTAAQMISDGMVVGLGTGSTADFFLIALAERIKSGDLKKIVGLPTSRHAEVRARELGIPITTFSRSPKADICIDGADEIDPELNLI